MRFEFCSFGVVVGAVERHLRAQHVGAVDGISQLGLSLFEFTLEKTHVLVHFLHLLVVLLLVVLQVGLQLLVLLAQQPHQQPFLLNHCPAFTASFLETANLAG
jgi:hypothetical protein